MLAGLREGRVKMLHPVNDRDVDINETVEHMHFKESVYYYGQKAARRR